MGSNVIRITKTERGQIKKFVPKKTAKLRKDGKVKLHGGGKKEKQSSKVYPLKNREDIENMKRYYSNQIDTILNKEDRDIAGRNKLLWIFSINVGLRMSDILKRTWGDIFYNDGSFKDEIVIFEQKTGKTKEFYLNENCKKAISEYIELFNPNYNLKDLIFKSRIGGAIQVQTVNKIIKNAAKECGIKFPVGTHTCRKTWAYAQIMAHRNDAYFMAHLMELLNHSSISSTLRYAGLEAEENKKYFNDVNL
jgi:integrase